MLRPTSESREVDVPFAPDILTPSQWLDQHRPRMATGGPQALLFAVLEDGVSTYLKFKGRREVLARCLYDDAREWIDDLVSHDLMAFPSLCEVFALDAAAVREALHAAAPPQPIGWRGPAVKDCSAFTDAAIRHLAGRGRPATTRELLVALWRLRRDLTLPLEEANEALREAAHDGRLLRLGRYWGLPSWPTAEASA